jgi:hypothetical protein
MAQIMPATMPVEETEEKLWNEYMVALARKQECWRLWHEAWRNYVVTGVKDEVKGRVWEKCNSLHDMWRDRLQAAEKAWKRVAYPLHGLPLRDEDADAS